MLETPDRQGSSRQLRERVVQRAAGVQVRADTAREPGIGQVYFVRHAAGMQAASRQAIVGAGVASACAACSRGAGSSAIQLCQLDTVSMLQVYRLATRVHAVPCQAEVPREDQEWSFLADTSHMPCV